MTPVIQIAIPVAVFVVSVVTLYSVPRGWTLWAAVISAIAMAVFVPSFSTSAPVAVVAILATVAVQVLALFRDRGIWPVLRVPAILIIFIMYSTTVGALGAPIALVLQYAATGVLLVLLTLSVSGAVARRGQAILLPTFGIILVVQFMIGFGEEFLGTKALWPRSDGTDNISHRVNAVLPSLIGRAMGSTSHPIPFGILFGFCVIVCLWFALKRRSVFYFALAMLGVVGMVFSGTRSAFVALAGALIVWGILASWRKKAVLIPVVIAALIGLPAGLYFVLQNAGSGFTSSRSFVHRIGILDTASNLFKREPLEVVFGTGFSSIQRLIEDGVVRGVEGISVVDEEFVRTLAGLGIVGLVLLLGAIIACVIRGNQLSILLLSFLVVGFVAFDSLSWRLIFTLFVVAIASSYGSRSALRKKRRARHALAVEDEHGLNPQMQGTH